jgi:hypothetical protein
MELNGTERLDKQVHKKWIVVGCRRKKWPVTLFNGNMGL